MSNGKTKDKRVTKCMVLTDEQFEFLKEHDYNKSQLIGKFIENRMSEKVLKI